MKTDVPATLPRGLRAETLATSAPVQPENFPHTTPHGHLVRGESAHCGRNLGSKDSLPVSRSIHAGTILGQMPRSQEGTELV